ncbi:MAG: hypothetical protein NC253_09060 [Ruminococcus sp.]|nr:hypothetical protein [Ruminococcus sp.]MCM1382557.1 hypothetical protein [Muribaculaceae bacterium]MCM1478385.1 hypothetical protein [Muribaculaceae bacterium]
MLTKPDAGWTDFQLEGTSVYGLSYLDDIAFEWLEQAIHGLETMKPFCVEGFLEPNRFLCTVSYWNCHIVCENDGRYPLESKDVFSEYSHTSMLQFCEYLYSDIMSDIDGWGSFVDYGENNFQNKKEIIETNLAKLEKLISERREWFGEDRCFL